MKKKTRLLLIVCCILAVQVLELRAADLTPEQLIAGHVKSIGDPVSLLRVQSLIFVGTSEVDFILGMNGRMWGAAMLASQGPKMGITMKFPDTNYPGEYFAYDGVNVSVGNIKPGLKSPIADFLYRYNKIMKNGLLGGVFSNAWPLLDVTSNSAAIMKAGKAKMDGKELYELEYRPKDNHGDMRIRIYFDPETFRHVCTEYRVRTDNDATAGFNPDPDIPMAIAQMSRGDSYYTLIEKFDDFKEAGALTLPHSYTLDYMIDGSNQSGFIAKWKIDVLQVGFNTPEIDQGLFKAEK